MDDGSFGTIVGGGGAAESRVCAADCGEGDAAAEGLREATGGGSGFAPVGGGGGARDGRSEFE